MAKGKTRSKTKSAGTRAESRSRYLFRDLAIKKGWNVGHVQNGGDFLEENEIEKYFHDIGLLGQEPDFLLSISSKPVAAVETKNEYSKLGLAIKEAVEYAEKINAHGKYKINIAIGFAGEVDKGYGVEVRYNTAAGWVPLTSHNHKLTAVLSKHEAVAALKADDGSTEVAIPDQSEFIDAAMELSTILRHAKVEAPLRPRVIGALVAAMYQGQIDITPGKSLASVNQLCAQAIQGAADIDAKKKKRLIDTLRLTGADYDRLEPHIGRITTILERLNVRSVLQTDTDFLGMFYEAFLRYGYDNNALGIVFTPRHITRLCVDLLEVKPTDRVIDIASGTGGFLVAAFDRMIAKSKSLEQRDQIRNSIAGFDTNPQIWALSTLNMFFRGDGKSHMVNGSCFDKANKKAVSRNFTRAFLNPPFSQEGEPERDFLDASMEALEPEGMLAAVVYSGVFADDEHKGWRKSFLGKHTLVGMISLPEDLFYPTAAPTSIVIAKAHVPHDESSPVFMCKMMNDGFEKLKGKRVKCEGGQLDEVLSLFRKFIAGKKPQSKIATVIKNKNLLEGQEWCPEYWLPQTQALFKGTPQQHEESALSELFRAVAYFPALADIALPNFGNAWSHLPALPLGKTAPLSFFFDIKNGKSSGEKNYSEGITPYISSGDSTNSVVSLVNPIEEEVFDSGAMTITAFGQACIQPWPFMARGNGGSSVRILVPKFKMSVRELIWFAAQINMQRWRFFYARMAIKGRLQDDHLQIASPPKTLAGEKKQTIAQKLAKFRDEMHNQSKLW